MTRENSIKFKFQCPWIITWKKSCPFVYIIICGYFLPTTIELSSCNRKCVAYKAKNIYHSSFYRKCLLTPGLYHYQGNMQIASLSFRRKESETLLESGLEETYPPIWVRMMLKSKATKEPGNRPKPFLKGMWRRGLPHQINEPPVGSKLLVIPLTFQLCW